VRTRRKSPPDDIIARVHADGMPYVIAAEIVAAEVREKGRTAQ
jgi:hypothetical protein